MATKREIPRPRKAVRELPKVVKAEKVEIPIVPHLRSFLHSHRTS